MSEQQAQELRRRADEAYERLGDPDPDQTFVGSPVVPVSNEVACAGLGPNPDADGAVR